MAQHAQPIQPVDPRLEILKVASEQFDRENEENKNNWFNNIINLIVLSPENAEDFIKKKYASYSDPPKKIPFVTYDSIETMKCKDGDYLMLDDAKMLYDMKTMHQYALKKSKIFKYVGGIYWSRKITCNSLLLNNSYFYIIFMEKSPMITISWSLDEVKN